MCRASSAASPLANTMDIKDDGDVTVITVTASDQGGLLMGLTGVFSALDISVLTASIRTQDDGTVSDEFRVQTRDGEKLPDSMLEMLKEEITKVLSSSMQSNMPAIYGMAAAAEVKRLRPLSSQATEGDAAQLELAAAEMAQSAASLVRLEREIVALSKQPERETELNAREVERQECAALLERKMAAMEAALAARRSPARKPALETQREGGALSIAFDKGLPPTSTGPAAGDGKELILQAFNWESCKQSWYKVLAGQAAEIEAAGYSAVWLPPPSDAVSPQGYLPRDLYDLNSKYGSEAELRDCIAVLKEHNLKVIADIVINHRCAHYQDDGKRWNKFGGRLAWDATMICCNNPEYGGRGNHKTGEDYTAAPNIDHTNERVQKDLIEWLRHLRKVGFDGWRFDFVKGYHGRFAKIYVDASVPLMAFGEYWDTCSYTDGVLNYNQDAHRQRTVDWVDQTGGTCAAFDFTTKGVLQEAVARSEYWRLVDAQGRPPGMLGLWPSRAITFIENHDTGSTLNHWPFPWNHLHEGYAYILTHPGTPCVFYDHHWQEQGGLGKSIQELLKLRKKYAIHARSKVVVRAATADCYAATVDDKIAMKIGHGAWSPNKQDLGCGVKSWTLASSGPQYAVWVAGK